MSDLFYYNEAKTNLECTLLTNNTRIVLTPEHLVQLDFYNSTMLMAATTFNVTCIPSAISTPDTKLPAVLSNNFKWGFDTCTSYNQ